MSTALSASLINSVLMRFSNRLSQKLVVTIPWTFWFVVNTDDGNEAGKVTRDILKAIDADLLTRTTGLYSEQESGA